MSGRLLSFCKEPVGRQQKRMRRFHCWKVKDIRSGRISVYLAGLHIALVSSPEENGALSSGYAPCEKRPE